MTTDNIATDLDRSHYAKNKATPCLLGTVDTPLFACLLMTGIGLAGAEQPLVTLPTRDATFAISGTGSLCEFSRNADRRSYLASNQPAPLLSVRVGGKLHAPDSAAWEPQTKRLTLRFAEPASRAVADGEAKPTHVVFEVGGVQPTNRVELVLWGPYPTTIGDIIGEVIGVVRDAEFAVGIQALNAKTLGGYPTQGERHRRRITRPTIPATTRTCRRS